MSNCVFYKYTNSDNNTTHSKNQQYTSKIIKNSFLIDNEVNTVNIILNKVHNYNLYFYVPIDIINLHISNNNSIVKPDTNWLFKFETKHLIYLKTYLKSLSSSRKYIYKLIEFYKYLLETINILQNFQIVHGNISFETIIIHNDIPLLVDFRHSLTDKSIYIKDILADNCSNYHRPLELILLTYLQDNKLTTLSKYNIFSIIDDLYINKLPLLQLFGQNIVDEYIEEAKKYFEKYSNKSYNEMVNIFWLNYFKTWDTYCLSLTYLYILTSLHKHIKINNKFVILFLKLLVETIHPNPNKRHSLQNIISKFDYIIYNCDKHTFKELLKII